MFSNSSIKKVLKKAGALKVFKDLKEGIERFEEIKTLINS